MPPSAAEKAAAEKAAAAKAAAEKEAAEKAAAEKAAAEKAAAEKEAAEKEQAEREAAKAARTKGKVIPGKTRFFTQTYTGEDLTDEVRAGAAALVTRAGIDTCDNTSAPEISPADILAVKGKDDHLIVITIAGRKYRVEATEA